MLSREESEGKRKGQKDRGKWIHKSVDAQCYRKSRRELGRGKKYLHHSNAFFYWLQTVVIWPAGRVLPQEQASLWPPSVPVLQTSLWRTAGVKNILPPSCSLYSTHSIPFPPFSSWGWKPANQNADPDSTPLVRSQSRIPSARPLSWPSVPAAHRQYCPVIGCQTVAGN